MTLDLGEVVTPFLLLCRAGAFLYLIPPFSGRVVPKKIRLIIALAVAILLAPSTAWSESLPSHSMGLVMACLGEVFVGLLMGFAVRLVFFAIEVGGEIISMEMGLMMTRAMDPFTNQQTSIISRLLYFFGIILFLAGGFHYVVLGAFAKSFHVVELGQGLMFQANLPEVVRQSARVFLIGAQMSAPLIAVNFVVTLTFAIMGKAVPKMNVLMASFSVRIWAGLTVFMMTLGLVVRYIYGMASEAPDTLLRFLTP